MYTAIVHAAVFSQVAQLLQTSLGCYLLSHLMFLPRGFIKFLVQMEKIQAGLNQKISRKASETDFLPTKWLYQIN